MPQQGDEKGFPAGRSECCQAGPGLIKQRFYVDGAGVNSLASPE
jgi:hypothetical protein